MNKVSYIAINVLEFGENYLKTYVENVCNLIRSLRIHCSLKHQTYLFITKWTVTCDLILPPKPGCIPSVSVMMNQYKSATYCYLNYQDSTLSYEYQVPSETKKRNHAA